MEFFISKPFVRLPLAILGGILFYLAWYPNIFWPFAFVGFVPIFIIEENFKDSNLNEDNEITKCVPILEEYNSKKQYHRLINL